MARSAPGQDDLILRHFQIELGAGNDGVADHTPEFLALVAEMKTITEAEDHLFCLLTMNHHPLHVNDVYASQSQQGKNVVAGPYVYSLIFGMTVSDVSGKAIANLATEDLSHPAPVFHGDTLFVESEVLEVRPSESKPDRGVVRVHTRAYNQDGTLVAEFKRAVLVPKKNPG